MVVIGVGNEYRRDDGAGLAVVTSLRDRVGPGAELAGSSDTVAWAAARAARETR